MAQTKRNQFNLMVNQFRENLMIFIVTFDTYVMVANSRDLTAYVCRGEREYFRFINLNYVLYIMFVSGIHGGFICTVFSVSGNSNCKMDSV